MIRRAVFIFSALIGLAAFSTAATTQAPMVAKAEDQAVIKPLVDAEKKAREALNAKIATLPESKRYQEAEKALKDAAERLNAAAEKLPENKAWKDAGAKTLDTAYRLQAKYQLSSREYRPELDDKGDLVFAKFAPKQ